MLGPPTPYPILARFSADHRPIFLTTHQRASFMCLLQQQVTTLTAELATLKQELVWALRNWESQKMNGSLMASAAEFTVNALKGEIAELTFKLKQLPQPVTFAKNAASVTCDENTTNFSATFDDNGSSLKRGGVEFFRISSATDLSTLAGNSSGAEVSPRVPIRPRPTKKDWSARIGCMALW
jgi:hypothetical protein